MVVCMHVGSSSTMPVISSDAPGLANLTFGAVRAAGTMLAWFFSDYFERMPGLKIALSEGNIGWMPYFIERAEQVIDKQRHWAKATTTAFYNNDGRDGAGDGRTSTHLDVRATIREHIFGCFIEESSGLRSPRHHRRGQRHARDRLPAQRHHLARLASAWRRSWSPTSPSRRSTRSSAATPRSSSASPPRCRRAT